MQIGAGLTEWIEMESRRRQVSDTMIIAGLVTSPLQIIAINHPPTNGIVNAPHIPTILLEIAACGALVATVIAVAAL